MEPLQIEIRYLPEATHMDMIEQGNWIDCYVYEDYDLKAGDFQLVNLGFSMKFPDGYEAILAARSSTFMKYGLLQANGIGVIDTSYSGPEDIWRMPVYATRDIHIDKDTRLCQFRLIARQQPVEFIEAQDDGESTQSRGGFGSTGD